MLYMYVSRGDGGREGRTDGRAADVGDVVRPLQEFGAGMGCGPSGDVHDAVCGADVEQPRRKVDVEEAIRVAEATRRTLACSTQRLFRTRKFDVREPTCSCALMSVTLTR